MMLQLVAQLSAQRVTHTSFVKAWTTAVAELDQALLVVKQFEEILFQDEVADSDSHLSSDSDEPFGNCGDCDSDYESICQELDYVVIA